MGILARLLHRIWGTCELTRVEGTDWIVRVVANGREIRVPPASRQSFSIEQDIASAENVEGTQAPASTTTRPAKPQHSQETRDLRHMFESLSNGLPPTDGQTIRTAVGFEPTSRAFRMLLGETENHGGCAMVVRGAYGQGKTFALRALEHMALESGFVVARTEVDATEIQLHKPHSVYRDLMRHVRIPEQPVRGAQGLARQTAGFLRARFCTQTGWRYCRAVYEYLKAQIDCAPLAWLLSAPQIDTDEALIGLLACDLQSSLQDARRRHIYPGSSRDWPAFNASTQGDFASYVLCGIGRLARLLGYKGFIVVLDEMEKWQNLNWVEQSKAGNLLGGLIWGATSPEGRRGPNDHPPNLEHSRRSGGYPFSTGSLCYLGVAIAMTPRGAYGPERMWETYGPIKMHDLPLLQASDVAEYCRVVVPQYVAAYGLPPASSTDLDTVIRAATASFRHRGTGTARSAVQAVVTALGNWRRNT